MGDKLDERAENVQNSINGDVLAFDIIVLLQTAITGSYRLPSDPSGTVLNANSIAKLRNAILAEQAPAMVLA